MTHEFFATTPKALEGILTNEFLSEKINGIDMRFAKVESMIKNQISEAKSDLPKWMFIFWVGQMTITIGIILLFIKN